MELRGIERGKKIGEEIGALQTGGNFVISVTSYHLSVTNYLLPKQTCQNIVWKTSIILAKLCIIND